jgi:hypothetical protein
LVDDGPYDRRIVEAVGRQFCPGADYIIVCNLLRQMGIYANVTFIVKSQEKTFSDVEEALNSTRWMVHGITAQEEAKLRRYLAETLIQEGDRWKMPHRRPVRWAVLWWEKE